MSNPHDITDGENGENNYFRTELEIAVDEAIGKAITAFAVLMKVFAALFFAGTLALAVVEHASPIESTPLYEKTETLPMCYGRTDLCRTEKKECTLVKKSV